MSTKKVGDGVTTPEQHALTLREAAERLGLRPRAMLEYVRRGELFGYVVRSRWQFSQRDINAFLEAGRCRWDFAPTVDREK